MKPSGAQMLSEWLVEEGVEPVFLVPGLQIDPLFSALTQTQRHRVVVATHELAAGFMADGYARASHRFGVCAGIGGAGACNMLTAAVTAMADSSAVLFLTGNVPAPLRARGAFQDAWPGGTNDVALFRQAVRYSGTATSLASLRQQLNAVSKVMRQPFPAPAHLAFPFDVQRARGNGAWKSGDSIIPAATPTPAGISRHNQIVRVLASSRQPLLLVGPRAVKPGGAELLRRFAETYRVPVATTLSAKGLLPETHPLSLGNFGYAGSRRANAVLLDGHADLLLVLGADFNERDSLCWDARLKPAHRRLVRIDPKPAPARCGLQPDLDVADDCEVSLRNWLALRRTALRSLAESAPDRQNWLEDLASLPRLFDLGANPEGNGRELSLDRVVRELRAVLPGNTNLVVDAGLHRVFAGHYWTATRPDSFFSACALAPMGWAIGAAIGIKLARTNEPVVVFTGDGCMRTHGTELATMARYGLPILIVVCNNRAYGSVHRRVRSAGGPSANAALLPLVDWPQFARALGGEGCQVRTVAGLRSALKSALAAGLHRTGPRSKPHLIDVRTPRAQALPDSASVCSALLSSQDVLAAP